MAETSGNIPPRPSEIGERAEIPVALLRDLGALSGYLRERGRLTYETAQRFAENARRHPETRAYDERQVTMLEYQHHIWQEIAGLVDRLVTHYGEALGEDESVGE